MDNHEPFLNHPGIINIHKSACSSGHTFHEFVWAS